MTAPALEIEDLHKRFGSTRALDGLSFTVPRGIICGFIGPNGAGKTTTFSIVASYVRPDRGRVSIFGEGGFDPRRHGGRVSILPQDSRLPPHAPVGQLLRYYARLQGMEDQRARLSTERVLDLVALQDRGSSRIRQLSHGMRRRVAVAQALLGDPELILLDEPTSGLDPELAMELREVLVSLRGERTLVISSHNLMELEEICDEVVFIEQGRCIRSGPLSVVTRRGRITRFLLERQIPLQELRSRLGDLDFRWEGQMLVVQAPESWNGAQVTAAVLPLLLETDGGVLEVHQGESLERSYLSEKRSTERSGRGI